MKRLELKDNNFVVKDNKVTITEVSNPVVAEFDKGQIENHLNQAKEKRIDADADVSYWENLLAMLK